MKVSLWFLVPVISVILSQKAGEYRELARVTLDDLCEEFGKLYKNFGCRSIAPEKWFLGMLLQAFYGVRSEGDPMEPPQTAGGRN